MSLSHTVPKGPSTSWSPKLPVNLAAQPFLDNKFEHYRWMREQAPVCPGRVSVLRVLLVSRYEDCAALAKDPRFVRNRTTATGGSRMPFPMPRSVALLAQSMIQEDDPAHRRLRGLVNQAFKPAAIARLGDQIEELTGRLLDGFQNQDRVDLLEAYGLPIPVTVIQRLLGVSEDDMPLFRDTMRYLSDGLSGWKVLRTLLWDLPKSVPFVREVIAHKRQNPGEDILTNLLAAEEGGDRLSEDELVSMVFLLIIAGFETTSHLITNGTLTLLQHPEAMDRLRAAPEKMPRAIEEILRFGGPVQGAKMAYAKEDVTWHEVAIKKGTAVFPLYGAANRDPDAFDDPETFNIDRDPNHHLGFGHGMHFCLGAQLARLETRIALGALLERFPNLRLAVPEDQLRLQALPGWHRYQSLPVLLA